MKRRLQQEDGAILLLALAFLAFIGVMGALLLDYSRTNLRATTELRPVRSTEFSADGAMEGAINKLGQNPALCATAKTNFYTVSPAINGQSMVLDCTPVSASPFRATLTAKCPTAGSKSCPANAVRLVTKVRVDGTAAPYTTAIESWSVIR